jgi:hypothetical protein
MRRLHNNDTHQTHYNIPDELVVSLNPQKLGLIWDDRNNTWGHHHKKNKRSEIPELKEYLWDIRKKVYLSQDPTALAIGKGIARYATNLNVIDPNESKPKYKAFYYFDEITDDLAKIIQEYGIKVKQDANRKWFLPEYSNVPNSNFGKNLQVLMDRFGMPTIGTYYWADFVGVIGRPSLEHKKNSTLISLSLRDDRQQAHRVSFIAHYIEGPRLDPDKPWQVPLILSNAEKLLRLEDGIQYTAKEVRDKFPDFTFPSGEGLNTAILEVRKAMYERGMRLYDNDPAGYTKHSLYSIEGPHTVVEHYPVPKESIYHGPHNFVTERENTRAWERCTQLAEQMAETYPQIGIVFKRDRLDQWAFYTNIADKSRKDRTLCFGQYQFCDMHELADAAEKHLESWILRSLHPSIDVELAPFDWKEASHNTKKNVDSNALYERLYDGGESGAHYHAVIARVKNSFIPIFDGERLPACPMKKSAAENSLDQHYTCLLNQSNSQDVQCSSRPGLKR